MATRRHQRPIYIKSSRLDDSQLPIGEKLQGVSKNPFARGNEAVTGDEVWAVRGGVGRRSYELTNTDDWLVRVVPNAFPLTDYHEVVIHSPSASKRMDRLSLSQVELVLEAYLARYEDLQDKGQVFIFSNQGQNAGETISHPHSQIVVFPTLPPAIQRKVNRVKGYFEEYGECIYCKLVEKESRLESRVVWQNEHFLLICPEGSLFPYQLCLLPKIHQAQITSVKRDQTKDGDQVRAWAEGVHLMTKLYAKVLPGVDYNYWIHSVNGSFFHWQMEMVPRLNVWGGVELGAGMMVNDRVLPVDAAKEFRLAL